MYVHYMFVACTDHRAGQQFIIPEMSDRFTLCVIDAQLYVDIHHNTLIIDNLLQSFFV